MAMIFASAVVLACTIAAAVFGGLVPFGALFALAVSLVASASLALASLAVATLALAASLDG